MCYHDVYYNVNGWRHIISNLILCFGYSLFMILIFAWSHRFFTKNNIVVAKQIIYGVAVGYVVFIIMIFLMPFTYLFIQNNVLLMLITFIIYVYVGFYFCGVMIHSYALATKCSYI